MWAKMSMGAVLTTRLIHSIQRDGLRLGSVCHDLVLVARDGARLDALAERFRYRFAHDNA
jgi:hypothetical protein